MGVADAAVASATGNANPASAYTIREGVPINLCCDFVISFNLPLKRSAGTRTHRNGEYTVQASQSDRS
jgi:hypothetical protein